MKTGLKYGGVSEWVRLNALLLVCMVAMRPLFFLEVYFRVGLELIHFFTILSGAVFDLLLVCRMCIYGLVPFLVLHRFFPKTTRGIVVGLIVLYVVVNALLAEYYCNLTMPLDHVILVYTPEELKTTVFSSASLSLAQVFWFVLQVGEPLTIVWLWLRRKRQWSPLVCWITVGVCLLTAVFVRYPRMIRKESLYPAHYDFCLAVNQPSYSYVKITDFIKESRQQAMSDAENEELLELTTAYHALHPEFEYDQPGYPFYRKANDPDVLGPFFNTTSDGLPPNVVVIIVEGLGRRLTGVTRPQLSFTPFVDSLAAEGLFWPNCLSTSERTFGVLPSVFASAPHGRYGFATKLSPMPRHHSLLLDMEQNGYTTSFYYGGDLSFDRNDFFMKTNHVDYLFMPQVTVEDSAQYSLLAENNRWGLDDAELFRSAIAHQRNDAALHRPFLDIYQTLTTHEPFVVDGIEAYEEQVLRMLEQTPGVSDNERANILRAPNIYGCFLYTDQSIRELFTYYASRPDFENTIFIITGDHRMAPALTGLTLRKYNVPLVVYSPLLKRHKTMNAVVSHLDITPSLNAYLHANYDYAIPDHCHWLGTSFDTTATFQNTRKLAFMLNNRDVVDYASGLEYITSGKIVGLDSLLMGLACNDERRRKDMETELETFDLLSRYVVQNDRLLPGDMGMILYNTHLDFEQNTLEVFDKYTVKGEGYLKLDQNLEYLWLSSDIAVRPVYENVLVEISFDVRNTDTTKELPSLNVGLGEAIQQYPLENMTGETLNTGQWEHFHIRLIVNTLEMDKPESLKLYLRNKSLTEYDLDNLVITVEGQNLK